MAIPLFQTGRSSAYVSAFLFGIAFLAAVAAMTTCVRRIFAPHAWTEAIGVLTVGFALGQSVGPVLAGKISDGANAIRAGLLFSIAILLLSVVIASFQRDPVRGKPAEAIVK